MHISDEINCFLLQKQQQNILKWLNVGISRGQPWHKNLTGYYFIC